MLAYYFLKRGCGEHQGLSKPEHVLYLGSKRSISNAGEDLASTYVRLSLFVCRSGGMGQYRT